jgi:hypothetical protein
MVRRRQLLRDPGRGIGRTDRAVIRGLSLAFALLAALPTAARDLTVMSF